MNTALYPCVERAAGIEVAYPGSAEMFCPQCESEDLRRPVEPPQPRNVFVQLVLAVGCAIVGIVGHPIWWLLAAFFATLVVAGISWNRTTWPKLYADWDRRFVCGRCGWVGVPSAAAPSECPPAS